MHESHDLPRYLVPGNSREIGVEVLAHGLPALPDELTYQMSFPIASWTAGRCAVVLFLHFRQLDDYMAPLVKMATYFREGERWTAHRMWASIGWHHDPIAHPGSLRSLGGGVIVTGGGSFDAQAEPGHPAAVRMGRVAPAVRQIALIQDGEEDRRPLASHFGAWVVCTDRTSPFEVTALDENGAVLHSIPFSGAAADAQRRRARQQQRPG
jgi:hypothetical protein